MGILLRRVRGAIGMGFTWALAWAGAGIVLGVITGFAADVPFPLFFGLLGFTVGVLFAAVLAMAERRRPIEQISLARVAAWGAVGGLLLSLPFAKLASLDRGDVIGVATTFALASAACAAGSLALARRAMSRADTS